MVEQRSRSNDRRFGTIGAQGNCRELRLHVPLSPSTAAVAQMTNLIKSDQK